MLKDCELKNNYGEKWNRSKLKLPESRAFLVCDCVPTGSYHAPLSAALKASLLHKHRPWRAKYHLTRLLLR